MHLKQFVWASAAVLMAAALTSCNLGKAPEPTPDVNGIYTSAAQTMVAGFSDQQTQTAQAAPPTEQPTETKSAVFTPLATFAPIGTGSVPFGSPVAGITPFPVGTPGTLPTNKPTALPAGTNSVSFPVGPDNAMFVGEDPVESAQKPYKVDRGKKFQKSWSLQNVGTSTWNTGYSFSFKSGDNLQPEPEAIVIRNEEKDFTAPGHSQAFVITIHAPDKPGTYTAFWQMKNASGVWFGSIVSVNISVNK
jgi:hypothetical protein